LAEGFPAGKCAHGSGVGDLNHAVLIVCASQHAVAMRRICNALRAAGVEVWFDLNELVGGNG
jgi:hypothetical protein